MRKLIINKNARLVSVVLIVFMMFGMFPVNVFAYEPDVDDLIYALNKVKESIKDLKENNPDLDIDEVLITLEERLDSIEYEHLQFLLNKMYVLINTPKESFIPTKAKEKLKEYGVNSQTVESFLEDVFEDNGIFASRENFQRFVDNLGHIVRNDFSEIDYDYLLECYNGINDAFTNNFPDAVGAVKDKLTKRDVFDLAIMAFELVVVPMAVDPIDPFDLTNEDKEYIESVIDKLPGDVKAKLQLYGINWAAYDKAINDRNIINDKDKALIRDILGITAEVIPPIADPKPGTYEKGTINNVTLASLTLGAEIYYTLDGSTPTTGSYKYTGPIEIDGDIVIKAIAVKNGVSSPVATFIYKFVNKVVTITPDDIVIGEGTAEVEIPNVTVGADGKTEPVLAKIEVSQELSEALGIPKEKTLQITLPPITLSEGQTAPKLTIAKPSQDVLDTIAGLGDSVLAIEISVDGLEGQTVVLVLPLPQGLTENDNVGAFHYDEGTGRWEFRAATVTEDGMMFETGLSPVAVTEAVEIPRISKAEPTANSVALEWTDQLNEAEYEIYQGDILIDTTEEKSYTVTGLRASTSYTFKVRAIVNNFESDFDQISVTTLSSGSPGGSGGGGGTERSVTISDSEVTKQLNAGYKEITFTAPKGTTTISIDAKIYNKISKAGKDLVIITDKVTLRIPAETFAVSDFSEEITFEVRELSESASKDAVNKLDANRFLLGKVFEINISTKLQKEVTVSLSYSGLDLTSVLEELLDVYWFDDTTGTWVAMNGTVHKDEKKIEFTTTHFSKYGIIAFKGTFEDIKDHWAKDDIEFMVGKGVIKGISATMFAPNDLITRAQFAALLVRAIGLVADTEYDLPFNDVSKSQWYYGEVAAAFKSGIVKGISDTIFAPNANITREEMATMISRAMTGAGKGVDLTPAQVQQKLAVFKDVSDIATWAQTDVAKAVELNIVNGRTKDSFVPKANATRAEGAVMIKRMYVQIH